MPELTTAQLSEIVNSLATENASLRVALMAAQIQLRDAREALSKATTSGDDQPANTEE